MSVNVVSDPNQVTTGDDAPAVETMQANIVVMKCPAPLGCHVARLGAMTCVDVEQVAVPGKVSTALTEGVFEEDLEVMISRSPTDAAANVQEAVTAEELRAHDAPLYVIVCAPAMEAVISTTMVISVFIIHNPVEGEDLVRVRYRK
jgi:hypothetical protein